MRDAPLVSACAAGIPKSTHSSPPVPELIPLSKVLPMMRIAFWCVWATYTTTELPEMAAHTAEPPEAAMLASGPGVVVVPSNALSAHRVTVEGTVDELSQYPYGTTVEPPEVAASAAESLEVSVVLTCELSPCPVTAKEAVCELSPCPVTVMEAVSELLLCSGPVDGPISELSSCSEPVMEADCELSDRLATISESDSELSVFVNAVNESDYKLSVYPESTQKSVFLKGPDVESPVCFSF